MSSDALTIVGTVSAAVAAVAALGTLVVAYLTFREGRRTIDQLRALAREAAQETAAQQAMVASMGRLVQASTVTTHVLHAVFLEAQAARDVDALLRVRVALAEVAYATQRITEGQPEIVFYGARQGLRAALLGVPSAERTLPVSSRMSTDTVNYDRRYEMESDHELDEALANARSRLAALNRDVSEQLSRGAG